MGMDYQLLEQQLGIVTQKRTDALFTIPAAKLLDRRQLVSFLELYQEKIRGLDLQVSATYFATSWRVVCAAMQYMVSVTPGRLHFSLENLTIQLVMVNGFPWVYFVLNDETELPWPAGKHSPWRANELRRFYGELLCPVMESIAAVSGLPVAQLWGQLPLGVQFYINAVADRLDDEASRSRLMEDYELVKQMPGEAFGLRRNPYQIKEILLDDPYRPGEKSPMKPTCCLAYRTDSGHGYCYGCPKLSKSEREAKYNEIREQITAAQAK
ncbi:(2Fe-2S)-binding protein [uncultured Paenibacillus sp.]|uniref:(2Fe-2S)-binding protein n=1 Tax=uncultured Paenibacillus sp. TaxID=227322 RepID=UPI0015B0A627|nr:(2Fe-2S)-binding protein [uncultured Paenibacillus sp.]